MRPKPEICIVLHWEYPPSLRRWGALPRNVASMESPPYLSSVAMAIDLCHCGLQSCKSKVVEFVHSEAEIGPAQLMASQILKVIKEAEDLEIRGEDDGETVTEMTMLFKRSTIPILKQLMTSRRALMSWVVRPMVVQRTSMVSVQG